MAKNMQNTAYRKLDVDAYDPEKYNENEEVSVGDTPGLGLDERTVQSMLGTNRFQEALHTALLNPPLKTKNKIVLDKATELVAKVICSFKIADIENAVKNLSEDEGDILMKYVYKAMELVPETTTCPILLAWHGQLVSRFGLGCIIRVFSDRNRL